MCAEAVACLALLAHNGIACCNRLLISEYELDFLHLLVATKNLWLQISNKCCGCATQVLHNRKTMLHLLLDKNTTYFQIVQTNVVKYGTRAVEIVHAKCAQLNKLSPDIAGNATHVQNYRFCVLFIIGPLLR